VPVLRFHRRFKAGRYLNPKMRRPTRAISKARICGKWPSSWRIWGCFRRAQFSCAIQVELPCLNRIPEFLGNHREELSIVSPEFRRAVTPLILPLSKMISLESDADWPKCNVKNQLADIIATGESFFRLMRGRVARRLGEINCLMAIDEKNFDVRLHLEARELSHRAKPRGFRSAP